MRILFLGSGSIVKNQVLECMKLGHEVVAIIPDQRSNYNWLKYISSDLIRNLQDVNTIDCELVIINEYSKIVDPDIFSTNNIINFHSGILPENRGYNSNLHAFLNGLPVGFSVNRVNQKMDDGEVIFKQVYTYDDNSTYQEIANKIYHDNVAYMSKIIELSLLPPSDNCTGSPISMFYSTRLKPDDAVITDFTLSGNFYSKIYKIFGQGTGMFLKKDNKHIKILSLKITPTKFNRSFIYVGSIVNREDNVVYIHLKDSVLELVLETQFLIGTRFDGSRFIEINS